MSGTKLRNLSFSFLNDNTFYIQQVKSERKKTQDEQCKDCNRQNEIKRNLKHRIELEERLRQKWLNAGSFPRLFNNGSKLTTTRKNPQNPKKGKKKKKER